MPDLSRLVDTTKFRLLIHHHDVAHVDEHGEIWLSSGIARWVAALSEHFESIGLLLHESPERREKQDTAVNRHNVSLHSLGAPGHYWDRFERIRRIRRTCQQCAESADGLLIRGLTPRQYTVWSNVRVEKKAFLLVRSPRQKRLVGLTPTNILAAAVNLHREREYRRIARSDTVLLANSERHLPEIEAIVGRAAHFVPTNTIRAAEYSPLAVRPLSSPVRLLFVGRLNVLKGIRELLRALSQLRSRGIDCVLDIVASPTEPQYSDMLKLASELGISGAVCCHGFVPFGKKLFSRYQSADVFVLPSYTEGFPRVIWEAAASCTPIVATAVGGIPTLLQDERHVMLVKPRDVDSLVHAIVRVLDEQSTREVLVRSAYELAQSFSVEACAQRLAVTLSQEWS